MRWTYKTGIIQSSQLKVFLSTEAVVNLKGHQTKQELQRLYRSEKDARLTRRLHAVYLAARGLSYIQIMTITGAARRTIRQWVRKYNKQRIDGLKDNSRPGQPTQLPRSDGFGMKRALVDRVR